MKPIIRIILMLFIILSLASCSLFDQKEESPDFIELEQQYDTYMTNDILKKGLFQDFVNQASLETSKSSVKIQVDFYHVLGYKTQTLYASGFVYEETEQSYIIMTYQEIFETSTFETIRVRVFDFNGNAYNATIHHESSLLNLASLIISKHQTTVIPVAELAITQALPNEPIMLISYQHRIINSMLMGFYITYTTDEPYILFDTTINTDLFGNGGMIINTSQQLIGMQISVQEGKSRALGVDTIRQYIKMITEDVSEE